MKNKLKKTLAVFMVMVMLCVYCLPFAASATDNGDQEASTYLTNCSSCTFAFTTHEGEAHVGVTYYAKSSVFTQAKLTVKIQKKVLGLFWSTVDIGQPNNEWVAYCTEYDGDFYNSFPLESTGTYRAVFTVEFYGTTGEVDVIEDTIESTYN